MSSHSLRMIIACVIVTAATTTIAAAAEQPARGKLRWEIVQLVDNLNEGIDVADVNRDGKPDLISGPFWFEGPKWTRHPVRDIGVANDEFFQNNGDHAIDLNGDGWVDVISASWFAHQIYWYENPGREGLAKGEKWKQHFVADEQHACEGLVMADLDGDKIPEIVVSSWTKERPLNVIDIKPGKQGGEPEFKVVAIGNPGYGHGVGVGDINGDGKADVFVNEGWYEHPAKGPWDAKPWAFHKIRVYHHLSVPCLVVDVNGDGKNDVIAGQAHDYQLRWLEQGPVKDGEITWTEHEIDKTYSQMHFLEWADLDGDGAKELITGKRWRGHKGRDPGGSEPVCIFRYVWNPEKKAFERDTITFDEKIGTGMQIRVADLDKDKRPDIAVAGKTGTYVLYNRGPAGHAKGDK